MKNLTITEIKKAPQEIQYIYMCAHLKRKRPIGSRLIDESMEKYPEYFQDEIQATKNWNSIPESIHESYKAECIKIHKIIFKDLPPPRGIFFQIEHPEEAANWHKLWNECRKKEIPFLKEIHKKYYSPFGLKFNEHTAGVFL